MDTQYQREITALCEAMGVYRPEVPPDRVRWFLRSLQAQRTETPAAEPCHAPVPLFFPTINYQLSTIIKTP